MPDGRALGGAEFAALMAPLGPWGRARRVAVAVSGGADSMCLAWLAARWGAPVALIVDHGLRTESAAEASLAARRLAGFGVRARILRIALAPGAGVAARARAARYAALQRAAAEAGLADLLVGHHARDQAETLLIREESGSGQTGLAGMASVVETASLRLVRPLLSVAPDRLRATLEQQGIGWSEDPSNADPGAARTRMRQKLAAGHAVAPAPGPARGSALGPALEPGAPARRRLREQRRAEILARRAALFPEGYALLTPGPIEAGCLAALIRALTGAPYPVRGRVLARLGDAPLRATLGGVRLLQAGRLGPGTLAVREAAAMDRPVPAVSGAVWDRRFVLAASGPLPEGATLGAVGADAPALRCLTALPDCVLRTLPALRAPGGPLAVPHLGLLDGWTNASVRLTLLPANPVAGAAFGVGDA